VVQWAFRSRFSREHLMINRGRGDIRRLVAPLSGIMADRPGRRRIMITCDLLGVAIYAGMAVTSAPPGPDRACGLPRS